MKEQYRIFGSEMSPYSVKVRSYFRYKDIPYEWVARRSENEAEYKQYARLPIIPTVVSPTGEGLQDSTPIIERLESQFPNPAVNPENETLAFLSALIEEFGDEWGNKIMFHYRWWAEIDQLASAQTLARLNIPNGSDEDVAVLAKAIRERMTGRGHFVGSSAQTAPLIQKYFYELLTLLETHLTGRKYMFGARPALGDFGLSAQLYEASVDPTCGSVIRARAPAVLDWCHRMLEPRQDGGFESWDALKPTLEPVLAYVGRYFLPWSQANADALAAAKTEFTVALSGGDYSQSPQKYHAKSLEALRAKYRKLSAKAQLDEMLSKTECVRYLA